MGNVKEEVQLQGDHILLTRIKKHGGGKSGQKNMAKLD